MNKACLAGGTFSIKTSQVYEMKGQIKTEAFWHYL